MERKAAGGIARVKRKEAGKKVEKAIAHAANAVVEDKAERYSSALEEYLSAVELLLQAINGTHRARSTPASVLFF